MTKLSGPTETLTGKAVVVLQTAGETRARCGDVTFILQSVSDRLEENFRKNRRIIEKISHLVAACLHCQTCRCDRNGIIGTKSSRLGSSMTIQIGRGGDSERGRMLGMSAYSCFASLPAIGLRSPEFTLNRNGEFLSDSTFGAPSSLLPDLSQNLYLVALGWCGSGCDDFVEFSAAHWPMTK